MTFKILFVPKKMAKATMAIPKTFCKRVFLFSPITAFLFTTHNNKSAMTGNKTPLATWANWMTWMGLMSKDKKITPQSKTNAQGSPDSRVSLNRHQSDTVGRARYTLKRGRERTKVRPHPTKNCPQEDQSFPREAKSQP